MSTLRRCSLLAGLAALTVGTVAGCTSSGAKSGSSTGSSSGSSVSSAKARTIGVVLPSEPVTLEPCNTNADTTAWVLRRNVTETLAVQDATTHQVKPVLATSWKQLSPTQWEFTLRTGVKFQDGSPFGAADVVHTIERFQNTKLACTSYSQFFNGEKLTAKAVNDSTVDITTSVPDPILPLHSAQMDIVGRNTPLDKQISAPVGTGPYKFVSWARGTSVTLARFDGYWGPKPQVTGVKYQWRDNPTIAAGMVTNNEADFAFALSPTAGAGSLAVSYAQSSVTYLRVDQTQPPLNDKRVRLAIRDAIDTNALINSVFKGSAQPASQIVTPAVDGYDPNLKPVTFDLNKAKQLLADAKADGVDTSKQITIIGRTDLYANTTEAMEAVQQMLEKAGLNVKVRMLTHEADLKYLLKPFPTNRGPVLVQVLHGNQCGDASCSLPQFYTQSGIASSGGTPELDSMITAAGGLSGAARTKAYQKAIDYITDTEARDVYLAQMKATVAVGKRISYTPSAGTDLGLPIADISYK